MAFIEKNFPGIIYAVVIAMIAFAIQLVEEAVLGKGRALIEGLVIAILLGMVVRAVLGLNKRFAPGVGFTAKQVLEFAVLLLGARINAPDMIKAGPILLVMIVVLVSVVLLVSTRIGLAFGLNPKLATLVAVGNSICGNSAIAAVAPVIGASKEDVASSVSLTAVLGVLIVLTLPVFYYFLGFSQYQYGVLAGMGVYAVPQVVAAGYSVSTLSGDTATLVKLVRVLMLGPVVAYFTFAMARQQRAADNKAGLAEAKLNLSFSKFVPWFISGFVIMAILRSLGVINVEMANAIRDVSGYLTLAAMAALGLQVDLAVVRKVGRSVALAVLCSLAVLISLSALAIKLLGINGGF